MAAPSQRGKKVKKMRDRTAPLPTTGTLPSAPLPTTGTPPSAPLPRPSPPPARPPSPPPARPPSAPLPPSCQESAPSSPGTSFDFSGKKQKRGKSCGKGLHNILEANGGKKMPVVFDMKFQVPNDDKVSALFTSEIGNIVRTSAPICYLGWRNVPLYDKRKMRESLLVLFEVDISNAKILEYVDKKMGKLFSQFKWRLHQHYLSFGTPDQGRANLPKPDLWSGRPESHWHWLCDEVYTAADFFEISKTNVANRKQQKYHHKGGAKPFIQHAKKAQKKGAPLSMIDNWGTLHKDKNNDQWINNVAKEKYDEMNQLRDVMREKLIQEAPEGTPLDSLVVQVDDEFEILGEKLGRKGRSIRGVGVFPRMEASNSFATSSMSTNSELTEIHDQLKQLSTNFLSLQKENEELKAQLKAFLVASQGRQHFNSLRGSFGVIPDDPYYDELADHDLDD